MLTLLLILLLGIACVGAELLEASVLGITFLYWIMAIAGILYCRSIFVHRGKLVFRKTESYLLVLCVYGVIRAILSMLGVTNGLVSEKVLIDPSYVPRQAYYLFFFPMIFLADTDGLTAATERMIIKYRKPLFFAVLFVSVLCRKEWSLPLTTIFILGFLALSEEHSKQLSDWLMAGIILLMPIAVGGEMTNALIRLIFAVVFLFGKRQNKLVHLMSLGIWGCIAACFVLPLWLPSLRDFLDANSLWRAEFWYDELKMVPESYFLGVGYGTSYCSTDFMDPATYIPWGPGAPFAATAQYSIYDKVFVTAAHNSFITMAFRLGIIGIGLFVLFLITMNKQLFTRTKCISERSYYAYSASLVIIALNVGLESPYYMLMFIFALCYGNYKIKCAALQGDLGEEMASVTNERE